MKSLKADFFREMKEGAEKYAGSSGNIELIVVGTDSQTEIDIQIQQVEKLIGLGVDAMLIVPIDSKALVPVAVKAVKAGITVVNIDIRLDEDILAASGTRIPFIGPDNKSAAIAVGEVLAFRMKEGDEVILIEGLTGSDNALQRASGFRQVIENHKLNLVASAPADWETGKAAQTFDKLYKQYPNIRGVFCSNDAMAQGVIQILTKTGKPGKIRVVGFDNDVSVQPLLDNGSLLATVNAYGSRMAIEGIEYVLKLRKGEKEQADYSTPYSLVYSILY